MPDGRRGPDSTTIKMTGSVDEMLDGLEKSGESKQMQGLDMNRLRNAMRAPGAAEVVAEIQEMGGHSQAGVGQPAPDFSLPYLPLPGQDVDAALTVRLTDRLINRPVALIFGSYT